MYFKKKNISNLIFYLQKNPTFPNIKKMEIRLDKYSEENLRDIAKSSGAVVLSWVSPQQDDVLYSKSTITFHCKCEKIGTMVFQSIISNMQCKACSGKQGGEERKDRKEIGLKNTTYDRNYLQVCLNRDIAKLKNFGVLNSRRKRGLIIDAIDL